MAAADFRMPMVNVHQARPVDSNDVPVWLQHSQRIYNYLRLWRYYKGQHWNYIPNPGEPVVTANYVRKFIDKHNQYLFGNGFTITANQEGETFQQAEDALNINWEKNNLELIGYEMGQAGGVTGDCWVNVGLDEDPVHGVRIKYSVIPSHYVFPIFSKSSQLEYDALLLQWPDMVVTNNTFGRIRTRTKIVGQYWTSDQYWELEDGEPTGPPRKNLLGIIPFVHISNIPVSGDFWGLSDLTDVVDLNREFNEKMTDISDIINYHAAPVTVIYGAKANQLQKGARKVWSGLPKDAKIEHLQLSGELAASKDYLKDLKDCLFQLSDMSPTAFGGIEAISNTSGVSLSIQFAPIIEHMKIRRMTFGQGIQRINFLTLKMMEILGTFKANGQPSPYYSRVKWPDPLPRDKQILIQNLQQMHSLQLISRVHILQELIHNDVAPSDLEYSKAADYINEAILEEQQIQAILNPQPEPGEEGGGGGSSHDKGQSDNARKQKQNETSAAENASLKAQRRASQAASGVIAA